MADIVLLALGESEEMSGEAQSRTEVVLPAPQQALAEAVAATGKPVIVILKNGRALALEGSVLAAEAILVTWFLGSETGNALADVLFGRVAPSGRLPVSFPRESGQEPYHYDHKPTGRPAPAGPRQPYKAQYRTSPNEARFPFGHGLTYGRIVYSGLDMGKSRLSADTPLTVTARIANRGTWPADEVVQLYIRDRAASITQPVRRLIDFQRVAVGVGESEEVRFTIRREDLLFVGPDLKPTVEPGWFDVWVAPSAADGLEGSFELVE
jgi:beta-glucosidase